MAPTSFAWATCPCRAHGMESRGDHQRRRRVLWDATRRLIVPRGMAGYMFPSWQAARDSTGSPNPCTSGTSGDCLEFGRDAPARGDIAVRSLPRPRSEPHRKPVRLHGDGAPRGSHGRSFERTARRCPTRLLWIRCAMLRSPVSAAVDLLLAEHRINPSVYGCSRPARMPSTSRDGQPDWREQSSRNRRHDRA